MLNPCNAAQLIETLRESRLLLEGFCVAFEQDHPFSCKVLVGVAQNLEAAELTLQEGLYEKD